MGQHAWVRPRQQEASYGRGGLTVLFVGEGASLAHVVRPLTLAKALDPLAYRVRFATGPSYADLVRREGLDPILLPGLTPQMFNERLAAGRTLLDGPLVEKCVEDDLALIAREQPDLIVGDFRCSLSISATLAGVPYIALANAHWSPYATAPFPLPEHPMIKLLGTSVSRTMMRLVAPLELRRQARAFNQVRRRFGLAPLAGLREIYTRGDWTLYLDLPHVAPTATLPPQHHYLGPLVWSPRVPQPSWWEQLDERPLVYVTMGSSGSMTALRTVIAGLAELPLQVALATAGRIPTTNLPANVRAERYLAGEAMLRRAALAICNGGSATVYQALAYGRPVIALPSNADQYFTAEGVKRTGAGLLIRADRATPERIRHAVGRALSKPTHRIAAQQLATSFAHYDARTRFAGFVAQQGARRAAARRQVATG